MSDQNPPHWETERWSLTARLRHRYPIGPRMENGEPEFGWREMEPVTEFGHPPIHAEAAHRIDQLEAEVARLSALIALSEGEKA